MQTVYVPEQFGVPSYTDLSQFTSQTFAVRKALPSSRIFPKLLPNNSRSGGPHKSYYSRRVYSSYTGQRTSRRMLC